MNDPGGGSAIESTSVVGREKWRVWAFVALCVAAVAGAGAYTRMALHRDARAATAPSDRGRLSAEPARPFLMVRSTASDDTWRRLVLAPLSSPDAAAYTTPLECDRAYFAANRGVCLVDERSGIVMNHYADIFDERFSRLHRVTLTGLASRTRVSPDGRYAGITVFESGHSYSDGAFSTKTTVIDTSSGEVRGDLEQFRIVRDGQTFRAVDFNFWGVTFAQDSNRFYVTLASGGTNYLVEGDLRAREGRVIRSGVECPSLSPDNTRIAYKQMLDSPGKWQLHVLDLRSGSDLPLTVETRSVDDQVDWLDNDHVMYHLSGARGTDIWVLGTDNSEPPRLLRHSSYSPAVIR